MPDLFKQQLGEQGFWGRVKKRLIGEWLDQGSEQGPGQKGVGRLF